MKNPVIISDDEKWQAVVECDSSFDGIFFYGVKTTGVFCRPSCRSKTPVRANVIFFDNAGDASEAGFRPCKRCCPDKTVFEPYSEIVKKVKAIFDTDYNKPIDLSIISKEVGVSVNHLTRLFKQQTGLTPSQYISKIRIDKAEELLGREDMDILEIASMTGFKSLSNFYKCFKEQTGYTPKKYRKGRGEL